MQPLAAATITALGIITRLLFSLRLTASFPLNDIGLPNCNQNFSCGDLTDITYPFTGGQRPPYCGPPEFYLKCLSDTTTILITNDSLSYRVIDLNQTSQTLRLSRLDLYDTACTHQFINTTLNKTIFSLGPDLEILSLFYGCNNVSDSALSSDPWLSNSKFFCDVNGVSKQGFYVLGSDVAIDPLSELFEYCPINVQVPIPVSWADKIWTNGSLLGEGLAEGFDVNYSNPYWNDCVECYKHPGGQCGFNATLGKPICICGDKLCPEKSSTQKKLGIALGSAGAGIIVMFVGLWILVCLRRKKRKAALVQNKDQPTDASSKGLPTSTTVSQSIPSYASSNSGLQKSGSTYFGVRVFTYEELEKATNYFDSSKQLGEGGFGTVYHGVLGDGRVVAVKRLYENNMRRAEQFMNEIEILALLQHKNLVKLYGCTSRHSRELLLVYEYIPNGTVADHLHGRQSNSGLLPLPVRLSIAIETASALAYLHASDVIHRDVKTNNILLDNAFHVKVADFGLSRLFPTDVTHVSTAPQGTPGYVDPEYYQCYQLTNKSDVYSFGVVLMELVSALEAVDTSRHRHDINLANMAVNKIQSHALHELVDPSLGFEKDLVVRRTVTSVSELAFRCLQQEREMRPTMDEVLEMLRRIEKENYGEGKAEVLDIRDDDVGLLKCAPPPLQLSPDSVADTLWISGSSTATPHSY